MNKTLLLLVSISLLTLIATNEKRCQSRGGCTCDCGWANPSSCNNDDRSCCWACCCNSQPEPSPSPPSPPLPPSPPAQKETYCPSEHDLTVAYGKADLFDQGWRVSGGGAAATKAAFNLLGGSVEFDFDVSGVKPGVNSNIYTLSPKGLDSRGFKQENYCDGAKPDGNEWCVEVDWIESNGNCGGATTLHTRPGPGNDGCTAWGCRNDFHYNGRTKFHVKITYDENGLWSTYRDGQLISYLSLNPAPAQYDWQKLAEHYSQRGAVIYSSQWVGWVPVEECGTNGDLNSSTFSVKNLKITGSVLQGPKPRKCQSLKYIETQ